MLHVYYMDSSLQVWHLCGNQQINKHNNDHIQANARLGAPQEQMHIQIQIQMSIGITHAVSPLCRGSSILRCESQVGLGGPWSCHHLDSWSIWRFWIWWWYHSSDLFRSFTDWLACPFIKRQKYFFASLRSQDSHLKKRPSVNSLGSFLS